MFIGIMLLLPSKYAICDVYIILYYIILKCSVPHTGCAPSLWYSVMAGQSTRWHDHALSEWLESTIYSFLPTSLLDEVPV